MLRTFTNIRLVALALFTAFIYMNGTAIAQEMQPPTRSVGKREVEGKKQVLWVGGGDFHDTARYYSLHRQYLETEQQLPIYITYTEETDVFLRLDEYDAVVMSHQLKNMTDEEEFALLTAVQRGKKIVALHGATAAFRYGKVVRHLFHDLLGARFKEHPSKRDIPVQIVNSDHPITQGVSDFTIYDEFYLFEATRPDRFFLLNGTLEGETIPLAWTRPYGDGEVFYMALGHGNKANTNPAYLQILKQAILWALE